MPTYYFIMAAYNLLALFIVVVLAYNLFKTRNVWEQVIAFFIMYPFILRMLLIK